MSGFVLPRVVRVARALSEGSAVFLKLRFCA
jgi:hypothetical protein